MMRPDRTPPKMLAASAQNLSRILIASYFMAVSLNLVGGTGGTELAARLIPQEYAAIAAQVVVFSLAFLVMIGVWLRPAALLLAIVLFWSSALAVIGPNALPTLDGFWRDLALIGALFLTYAQSGRAARLRSIIRRRRKVRKIAVGAAPVPRRITATVNSAARSVEPVRVAAIPRLVPDLQPVPVPEFRARHRRPDPAFEGDDADNIFVGEAAIKVSA